MNKYLFLALVASLLSFFSCQNKVEKTLPEGFDPEGFTQRELVECTPRKGLPNFFKKLESGADSVTIAYFGGSITSQPGYRVQSTEYIQSLYPETKIVSVDAAIGGTGSDLGVFRCRRDVLNYSPDLVFVEFAVNDAGRHPIDIRLWMEGIVRQIWDHDSRTDIIFVYTLTQREQETLLDGKMQRSSCVMEDIADWYDIPTIHFGAAVKTLLEEDRLVIKSSSEPVSRVSGEELNQRAGQSNSSYDDLPLNADGKIPFSDDGTHPFLNTGHVIYERAIERSLPLLKDCCKAGPHRIPQPMVSGCLDNVTTLTLEDGRLKKEGTFFRNPYDHEVTKHFLNRCDYMFTFEPGSTITFKFKGSEASVYDLIGPESSTIKISVDGSKPVEKARFDGYCTYHRLALLPLCSGLDPEQVHTVKITVSDVQPDKREILFERNRGDFDNNPEKYYPMHYFVGCFFVVGDVVDF